MSTCTSSEVPVTKGDKLKQQCPKTEIEKTYMSDKQYASIVGGMIYAQVCT